MLSPNINEVTGLDTLLLFLNQSSIDTSYEWGRKFCLPKGERFSLDESVQQLSKILQNTADPDPELIRSVTERIKQLDTVSDQSHLNPFFRTLFQFFSSLFRFFGWTSYDRNKEMEKIFAMFPAPASAEQRQGIREAILNDPYFEPHFAFPQQDWNVIAKDLTFSRNPDIKRRLIDLAEMRVKPTESPLEARLVLDQLLPEYEREFLSIAAEKTVAYKRSDAVPTRERLESIYQKLEQEEKLDEDDLSALDDVRSHLIGIQDTVLQRERVARIGDRREFLFHSHILLIKIIGLLEDKPEEPIKKALQAMGWPELDNVLGQVLDNRMQYNSAAFLTLQQRHLQRLLEEITRSKNKHVAKEVAARLGVFNTIRRQGPSKDLRRGTFITVAELQQLNQIRTSDQETKTLIRAQLGQNDPLYTDWDDLMAWSEGLEKKLSALRANRPKGSFPFQEAAQIEAKKFWRDTLVSPFARTINLFSDRDLGPAFAAASGFSHEVDKEVLRELVDSHRTNRELLLENHRAPKAALIEGAGPSGLLTALTQYEQGVKVDLREKRSGEYSREQMVRLDPIWMGHLQYLLGSEFQRLFSTQTSSDAAIDPHGLGRWDLSTGAGFVQLKELEASLATRARELADLDSNNFKITYSNRIDRIESQDGAFIAHTSNPQSRLNSEESLKDFDLLFTCGGKRSAISQTMLSRPTVQTEQRYYGITVWKTRLLPTQTLALFRDFRAAVSSKALQMNLKKFPVGNQQLMERLSQELDCTAIIEVRTFEDKGQVYLASQMPTCLEEDFEDKNRILDQWFKAIGATLGLDTQDGSHFLEKVSTRDAFHVSQGALTTGLHRYEDKSGHKLTVIAVGDSLQTPHFMTASGLSSARHVIDASVELTKALRAANSERAVDDAIEAFKTQSRDAQEYALFRGRAFLNPLSQEEIERRQTDQLERDLLEAKIQVGRPIDVTSQGYTIDGQIFPNLFALRHYLDL